MEEVGWDSEACPLAGIRRCLLFGGYKCTILLYQAIRAPDAVRSDAVRYKVVVCYWECLVLYIQLTMSE